MSKLLRLSMAMRFTLAGAAVIAIAPLCLSFMPARQSGRSIVIKNVRIFDGSTVIPTGAVIFEGAKIKSVGKTAERGKTITMAAPAFPVVDSLRQCCLV